MAVAALLLGTGKHVLLPQHPDLNAVLMRLNHRQRPVLVG